MTIITWNLEQYIKTNNYLMLKNIHTVITLNIIKNVGRNYPQGYPRGKTKRQVHQFPWNDLKLCIYLTKSISFSFDNHEIDHVSRNNHYSRKNHTPSQELHLWWVCVLLICERSIGDTEEDEDEQDDERADEHPAESPVPVHLGSQDDFHVFDEVTGSCEKGEFTRARTTREPPSLLLTW